MLKVLSILIILSFLFNADIANASRNKRITKKQQRTTQQQPKPPKLETPIQEKVEERSRIADLLAIPVGGVIGFGLGHGLQGRYRSTGWVYSLIDVVSLGFVASMMGSCRPGDQSCEDRKDQHRDITMTLFYGSRLVQVFDLSYFYSQQTYAQQRKQKEFYFAVVPTSTSLHANLGWSF